MTISESVAGIVIEVIVGPAFKSIISPIIRDVRVGNEFKNAIEKSFEALIKAGYPEDGAGKLYEDYFKRDKVRDELWRKIIDTDCPDDIDYQLLEDELRKCWQSHIGLDENLKESLLYFLDELQWQVWTKEKLREILKVRLLQDLSGSISPKHAEAFRKRCLEFLARKEGETEEFRKALGGGIWIEPAILKYDANRKLREKAYKSAADERKRIVSLKEILKRDGKDYIIVANSGMGKTTLLKWLELNIGHKEVGAELLPIYFHLSSLQNCNSSDGLIKMTADLFGIAMDRRRLIGALRYLCNREKLVFLLDGLDQIKKQEIILNCLRQKSLFGKCKAIIGARPIAYDKFGGSLSQYQPLELMPFDTKRLKSYLRDKWNDPQIKRLVRENPQIVRIPILLQMIYAMSSQNAAGESQYKNKTELYTKFIDHLSRHEKELDDIFRQNPQNYLNTRAVIEDEMRRLCYQSINEGYLGRLSESDAGRYLDDPAHMNVLLRWGLFNKVVEQEKESLLFRHQSFQEYFAAFELKNKLFDKSGNLVEDELTSHLEHFRWDESIKFMAGLLSPQEFNKLIKAIADLDIILAAQCLGQGAGEDSVSGNIIAALKRWIRSTGNNSGMQALLESKTNSGFNALIDVMKDAAVGDYIRGSAAIALGALGDATAVAPLIDVMKDAAVGDDIRGSAADALGALGDATAVAPLIDVMKDAAVGYDIRRSAAYALGALIGKYPDCFENIIRSLKPNEIRQMIKDDYYYGLLRASGKRFLSLEINYWR
jgi:hypothetical protein